MLPKGAKPAEDFQSIFDKSMFLIMENQRLNQAIGSVLQKIDEKHGDNDKLVMSENIADNMLLLQKLQLNALNLNTMMVGNILALLWHLNQEKSRIITANLGGMK